MEITYCIKHIPSGKYLKDTVLGVYLTETPEDINQEDRLEVWLDEFDEGETIFTFDGNFKKEEFEIVKCDGQIKI